MRGSARSGPRAPRGVGTITAAVIAGVAAVPVVGYTLLEQMACDSCTGSTLESFSRRYQTAALGALGCLVLAVALLIGGWFAARAERRTLGLLLTWLAPVVVAIAALLAVVLIRP